VKFSFGSSGLGALSSTLASGSNIFGFAFSSFSSCLTSGSGLSPSKFIILYCFTIKSGFPFKGSY
jgi:hypothetical protein